MGLEFTFHEYIDAWGRSFVGAWLRDDVSPMVRQKFNEQFGYLEGTPRTQWSMPYVRPVGDGLLEARVQWDKRLYRILLTHTPGRKPTLLHGFVKRGKKLPPGDKALALARRAEVRTNPGRYQLEYSYE